MRISDWSSDVCSSDLLGTSIFTNLPVTTLIGQRLEPTVMLALTTIVLSVTVAVSLGAIAAWQAGSLIDRFVMQLSVGGFSVTALVLGHILLSLVSMKLQLLTAPGHRSPSQDPRPFLAHTQLTTHTVRLTFIP